MAEQAADHFESLTKQAHAAKLGMWIFLGSEALFFAGLFTLYAAYRVEHPVGFGVGVATNTVAWGSTNTLILLASSYTLTLAVRALRRGDNRGAGLRLLVTIALGTAFALVKIGEWLKHFSDKLYPGGLGDFYAEHGNQAGTKMFYTLYFCMTGLHEVHVVVGIGILSWLLLKVWRREIGAWAPHPLELGSLYWHFVDMVWLFLWPMLYLMPGGGGR